MELVMEFSVVLNNSVSRIELDPKKRFEKRNIEAAITAPI